MRVWGGWVAERDGRVVLWWAAVKKLLTIHDAVFRPRRGVSVDILRSSSPFLCGESVSFLKCSRPMIVAV